MVVGAVGATPDVVSNFFSGFPPTIGGDATTVGNDQDNNDAIVIGCIFYKTLPATGSQTFAWNWSGTGTLPVGGTIYVAFYTSATSISLSGSGGGAQDTDNSATTGSLTAVTGNAVFAVGGLYNDSTLPTATWTNATELNDSTSNGLQCSVAEAFPAGNVTITCAHSGGTGSGPLTTISAIVLQEASSAIAVIVNKLRRQRL
jgi:hypothetical protein